MTKSAADVNKFWCEDNGPAQWFKKDDNFDESIRANFMVTYNDAAKGDLDRWAAEPEGLLALMILLDQFPRNMFRDSAQAFATDDKALSLAKTAIKAGVDMRVSKNVRQFIYLPFEHSENMDDQNRAVSLMGTLNADLIQWAENHRIVIEKFGRFPHRNKALGRESTSKETQYIDDPATGF